MVKTKMYFARYHLLLAVCNVYRRGGGAWLVRGSENSDLFIHITHSGDRRCTDTHTHTLHKLTDFNANRFHCIFFFPPNPRQLIVSSMCHTQYSILDSHTPSPRPQMQIKKMCSHSRNDCAFVFVLFSIWIFIFVAFYDLNKIRIRWTGRANNAGKTYISLFVLCALRPMLNARQWREFISFATFKIV